MTAAPAPVTPTAGVAVAVDGSADAGGNPGAGAATAPEEEVGPVGCEAAIPGVAPCILAPDPATMAGGPGNVSAEGEDIAAAKVTAVA